MNVMNIVNVAFQEKIFINYQNTIIEIIIFKTTEKNNIKFGINAQNTIKIYREEIYNAMSQNNIIPNTI